MLPEGGVGSAAPACWYNSVLVTEGESLPEVRNDNPSPAQYILGDSPDDSVIEEEHHGNNESNQAHLEKLAKPKKSCLTDKPFPARLHQKKKVVAFGRTVNYSQTIEASSKRDHNHSNPKPAMNKAVENKENKPPPTAVRALSGKPEPFKRKSLDNDKVDQDNSSDLLAMKEQLKRNEEKNEVLFAQLFKKLEELTTVNRPEPSRTEEIRKPLAEKKPEVLYRNERAKILDSIQRQLECDPGFITELTSYCRNMETKLGFGSPTPTDDYARPSHRPTLTRSAVATTRERNEVTRNDRSGAFVTERMTVERSFMSPGGEPFSVDSRRFLGNRGLIGGVDKNQTSPTRSRSIQNAPQSYYQPGYSVAYVPQRSLEVSSDDENCGTVLQLTDEQYEKQCAAREAKLRNTPFVSEIDDHTEVRARAPEDRIRREVQRQLEEKRRRRDEILKK